MAEINTVADLLRKHAEMRGQQIAFSGSGQTVNYAELAAWTGRIAVSLQCAGVKRGLRVAIVLGSCIEAVESIFAITRASAVGVPLDPRSSQAELAKTLKRSCLGVIFTDSKRFGRVCAAILSLAGAAERRRTIVVVDRGSNDLKSKTNMIVPDQGFVVRHMSIGRLLSIQSIQSRSRPMTWASTSRPGYITRQEQRASQRVCCPLSVRGCGQLLQVISRRMDSPVPTTFSGLCRCSTPLDIPYASSSIRTTVYDSGPLHPPPRPYLPLIGSIALTALSKLDLL
ncbi:hypothetical protein BDV09DRAFT_196505 [Aspergillus tetrazonus]